MSPVQVRITQQNQGLTFYTDVQIVCLEDRMPEERVRRNWEET